MTQSEPLATDEKRVRRSWVGCYHGSWFDRLDLKVVEALDCTPST